MDQDLILTRMLRAAQSWGRQWLGSDVTPVAWTKPEAQGDGAVTAEVEIQREGSPGATPNRTRLVCIVTLEPDGRLGCIKKSEVKGAG